MLWIWFQRSYKHANTHKRRGRTCKIYLQKILKLVNFCVFVCLQLKCQILRKENCFFLVEEKYGFVEFVQNALDLVSQVIKTC